MAVEESLTSERVSRISNTRWVAPCASLICANTRAAELKGPIIIPAKRTNAKRSPGDTLPSMTWRPPYHNTAAAAEKVRRLMTGINTAMVPARSEERRVGKEGEGGSGRAERNAKRNV